MRFWDIGRPSFKPTIKLWRFYPQPIQAGSLSHEDGPRTAQPLNDVFDEQSGAAPGESNKATRPFSIRLTDEEKRRLSQLAGGQPLSAFARHRLLGSQVRKRCHSAASPSIEAKAVADALVTLGTSHLSQNLNQLAKAAHLGILPVTPSIGSELQEACVAVSEMRTALLNALGQRQPVDR